MFPGPTELRLIGCSIELTWTPKSKSSTSTPKTELADILTKGNFTRDEWNIFCVCSISAISVLKFALKQWREDFSKIQEENESQQNRDQ